MNKSRPYFNKSTKELFALFNEAGNNEKELKKLEYELKHRERRAARRLLSKVHARLYQKELPLFGEPETAPLPNLPGTTTDGVGQGNGGSDSSPPQSDPESTPGRAIRPRHYSKSFVSGAGMFLAAIIAMLILLLLNLLILEEPFTETPIDQLLQELRSLRL